MICFGIEGTAHSIGVGIIKKKNEKCEVLSNLIKIYRPEKGGIHRYGRSGQGQQRRDHQELELRRRR